MRSVPVLQFGATALVWGASFLFVKIALEGLSFTQVVLWRLVFGAIALVAIALIGRIEIPRDRRVWMHAAALAIMQCIVPWLLFSWAGQQLSSGLASIYNATTPLMTMALSLVYLPGEVLTRYKATGLLLGFGGVMVVLAPWNLGVAGDTSAQLACLGATAAYGVSYVYLRRYLLPLGVGARAVALLQIGIAALLMILTSPLIAWTPMRLTPAVVLSTAALGVLGTGLAFIWSTNVVREWGPAAASTVTYLSPVVGVALGAVILGEKIGWNEPLGALAVIAGILVTRRATQAVTVSTTPPKSVPLRQVPPIH
ncbi:drug/metabolite transporter (DMT)-like permease [Rhodococcus sp. 27YEA15]|uniref:DMT family transporter n=1 Tax=Rhodococcus sp. 27YEA15 TaxID=3156259 RepID=UPI003C7B72EE